MGDRSARFPNKLLVIGVAFTLVGVVLLLWTFGYLEGVSAMWPVAPLIGGLILLYLFFLKGGHDYYLFLGMSLALSGALLLLTTTVLPAPLMEIWPVFMMIIGVSLFLYGGRKSGTAKVSVTIPGIAMLVLSLVFLPFSLDLVTVGFVQFVGRWWPVMFVVIGLGLGIAHFIKEKGTSAENE
jgi:hypothetical protein